MPPTRSNHTIRLPHVGLRNLKTAIAATLCALLYALLPETGENPTLMHALGRNPTFACIGAVFAMNSDLQSSWETGGNRLWGTVIGGFTGMAFFALYRSLSSWFLDYAGYVRLVFLFFGIIAMIVVSQIFHVNGAIPSGSVVFYIVMLNTPENQYVIYALNRMLDTGVGVLMSILVNVALPRSLFERFMSRRSLDREITLLQQERVTLDEHIDAHIAALEQLEDNKPQ